jgi:hypothetical protein
VDGVASGTATGFVSGWCILSGSAAADGTGCAALIPGGGLGPDQHRPQDPKEQPEHPELGPVDILVHVSFVAAHAHLVDFSCHGHDCYWNNLFSYPSQRAEDQIRHGHCAGCGGCTDVCVRLRGMAARVVRISIHV